ncbi:MAG: DUF11 domain-containing protein, partial [Ketobacter sp.]|nr:DUF11 domain-containing protein [Ketobacter sp.]
TDDGTHGADPTPENNIASDTNQVLTVRADAGGPYAGDEGAQVTFDASASSDRDGTVVSYQWDLDADGAFDDATGVTASRSFDDDGTFTIAVRVTDDSGEVDTATAEVTVANLPPVVDAGADRTFTEGDSVTLAGTTFADPGIADAHTATIDWGDGSPHESAVVDQAAGTVAGGHNYLDDGAFSVEICVTDDGGESACASFTATVENADPATIAAGGVDLDTWNAQHLSAQPGDWAVASDGSYVDQTRNSDPTVFYGPFAAIGVNLEGEVRVKTPDDDDFLGFVLGFHPGDFGNPDADYLLIDWKQESQVADWLGGQLAHRGLAISRVRGVPSLAELWGHTATGDNGTGLEQLQRGATRGDTGWAEFTTYGFRFEASPGRVRVFVDGTLELDVIGDFDFGSGRFGFYNYSQKLVRYKTFTTQGVAIDEGGTAELEMLFSDAGIADTHIATIDWQDGTTGAATVDEDGGSGTVSGSHTYLDDADLEVEVCVTDDDGGTGCGSLPVTVVNAPPALTVADQLAHVGRGLDLAIDFTDPGILDTHTATIDWGDGLVEDGTVTDSGGAGTVTGFHVYDGEGIYSARVCVTDSDGDIACDDFQVTWLEPVLDMSIEVLASRFAVRPGEAMTYTVLVINRGTLEPEGLEITLELPAELSLADADRGGTAAGQTVTWTLPALAYQGREYFTADVQAPPVLSFGETVTATATVADNGAEGPDVNPADNVDSSV